MADQFTNGYALVIGIDENAIESWALPDVLHDVQAVVRILVAPDRCAYPAENVKLLTGAEATRANILAELDHLKDRLEHDASGNATAFLYYSGHGWRDTGVDPPEYYLIPFDMRADRVRSSALRATDFVEALACLHPRRLLAILDCCHAAGMGVKGAPVAPPGYIEHALPAQILLEDADATPVGAAKGTQRLAEGSGRAVLTSSQGEQSSFMHPDRRMSIFTFHLIEALTGHAQPQAGASEVLVSDVISYVTRHVPATARRLAGAAQEPGAFLTGNFPVALLLGGKGLAAGEAPPDVAQSVPAPAAGWHIVAGGDVAIADEISVHARDIGRNAQVVGGQNIHISSPTRGGEEESC